MRLKRLLNNKQNIIAKVITGYPSNKEGKDGDLQIRQVPNKGLFLFFKYGHAWYGTRLNKVDIVQNPRDERRVVVYPGAVGKRYDSNVIQFVNDEGVLRVRNSTDGDDANLMVNQIRCTHVLGSAGNKTVEVGEAGGTIRNHLKITNAVSGSGPAITSAGDDTNIPITITSKGTGDATFKAVTGDIEINAGGVDITFKRSLTTLGSFDTSGNFTATGTSASSNGTCLGKYQYESIVCGFTSLSAGNFLPLVGGVENQTGTLGKNEYIGMVAPYTGTIEKILFRSEVAQNGTLEMDIHESADGTEVPAASAVATKDTSINIADDTTQDISFASMTSGTNVITKGRIYAIKITSPSAPQDTNVTVVFKWDVTT